MSNVSFNPSNNKPTKQTRIEVVTKLSQSEINQLVVYSGYCDTPIRLLALKSMETHKTNPEKLFQLAENSRLVKHVMECYVSDHKDVSIHAKSMLTSMIELKNSPLIYQEPILEIVCDLDFKPLMHMPKIFELLSTMVEKQVGCSQKMLEKNCIKNSIALFESPGIRSRRVALIFVFSLAKALYCCEQGNETYMQKDESLTFDELKSPDISVQKKALLQLFESVNPITHPDLMLVSPPKDVLGVVEKTMQEKFEKLDAYQNPKEKDVVIMFKQLFYLIFQWSIAYANC